MANGVVVIWSAETWRRFDMSRSDGFRLSPLLITDNWRLITVRTPSAFRRKTWSLDIPCWILDIDPSPSAPNPYH